MRYRRSSERTRARRPAVRASKLPTRPQGRAFPGARAALRKDRLLALVVAGIALAACVVVLGAYTRLVDAGLGCPDWPGCYGLIGVPDTPAEIAAAEAAFPDAPVEVDKAWPEMVHRYFATGLGALILGMLGLAAWRRRRIRLPAILTVMVIVQGAFGAWTVTLKLWPQVVTAHLLGGMATLATLWLYALLLARPRLPPLPDMRRLAVVSLGVLILQIALGGWVSANYAGLACPDFPLCHGEVVPPLDVAQGFDVTQDIGPNYLGGQLDSEARIAIQIGHRLGAVLVLVVVGFLCVRLHRAGRRRLASAVGVALGLQWALGIANVLAALPLALAVLHNAFAGALLLAVVTVNFAAFGSPQGGAPAACGSGADTKVAPRAAGEQTQGLQGNRPSRRETGLAPGTQDSIDEGLP